MAYHRQLAVMAVYCFRYTCRCITFIVVVLFAVLCGTFLLYGSSFSRSGHLNDGFDTTTSALAESLSRTVTSPQKPTVWGSILHGSFSGKRECEETQFLPGDKELEVFKPAVTGDNFWLLMDTVVALCRALTKANVPFFLYGGALIGSWRHHGLVPWDDDVDIAVDFTRRRDLRKALLTLEPQFLFEERPRSCWKLFSEMGSKIGSYSWRWPFVDVCFFDENFTHVFEHELEMFPEYVFPKDWIFPTVLRPLNGRMLPAPKKARLVLDRIYNVTQCAIGHYNHRREERNPKRKMKIVTCDRLRTVYPFVEHVPLGAAGCNETLVLNGTALSWCLLDRSQC